MLRSLASSACILGVLSALSSAAAAQAPARADSAPPAPPMPRRQPTPNDSLVSPEVASDGRVTLRIYAPKASEVVAKGDVAPSFSQPLPLTRDARGVWTGISAPLPPGAYQYTFVVDGVATLDPKNLAT